MLDSRNFGYAVMNRELTAYSLEDTNLETCKRYCRNGDVIAEKIPYVCGLSIRFMWHKFNKPFYFKYSYKNFLWLHWSANKEYLHKTGKVVFASPASKEDKE